jgi:hypothetical protein
VVAVEIWDQLTVEERTLMTYLDVRVEKTMSYSNPAELRERLAGLA